jgi:putative transposase
MRYPASEKLEIIRIVEQSHLPAKRTLDQLGIARRTFYRWYDRYLEGGPEALEDRPSAPSRVWNRIPRHPGPDHRAGAGESELSPRELAVRFTDEKRYFVSEATVYRLLKAHDLITSPAYVVIKAADQFHTKTTRPNEMWQTDFTYFKIIGWGWMYLSTVLDDFSRYIIAWKLCTNMRAEDVTDTLDLALAASGCDSATVLHKPRLLSDNGPSYIAGELAEYIEAKEDEPRARCPDAPANPGQDRALAPDPEEPHPAGKLLPARRPRSPDRGLRRALQPPALPREPEQRDARRRLLRQGAGHHQTARKDQATDHRISALATPQARRLTSTPRRGPHSANLRRELCQMF